MSNMGKLLNVDSLRNVGGNKKSKLPPEASDELKEINYLTTKSRVPEVTTPTTEPEEATTIEPAIASKKTAPVIATKRSRTKYTGPVLSMRTRPGFKDVFDDVALEEGFFNLEFIEVLLAEYLKSHEMNNALKKLRKLGISDT